MLLPEVLRSPFRALPGTFPSPFDPGGWDEGCAEIEPLRANIDLPVLPILLIRQQAKVALYHRLAERVNLSVRLDPIRLIRSDPHQITVRARWFDPGIEAQELP